jgi:hypothetical protein
VWFDRRWKAAWAWFRRRPWRARMALATAAMTSPLWCCCGVPFVGGRGIELYRYWFDFTPEDRDFWRHQLTGYANRGLPSAGRRLKAEAEAVPNLETALDRHPDWATLRFANGEWVVWRSLSSTTFQIGGGTAVVRDSRGRVRVYFGFVKFDNEPLANGLTLAEYDDNLARNRSLREWAPNP